MVVLFPMLQTDIPQLQWKCAPPERSTWKIQGENSCQCQFFKGTRNCKLQIVMQIEKSLINDPLCVPKVSWKFHIPTIYNFALICPWNSLFS